MTPRTMLPIGALLLAVGGTAVTAITVRSVALATVAPNARKAAGEARAAQKALVARKALVAVTHAEVAVANDPQNAGYRTLLGQAYLLAGRFTSAAQALHDALALDPQNDRAVLNLVLARIGTGDWAGARTLLQAHGDRIPAADRGLAYALAGDPATAIDILAPAVRAPGASSRTRQNLAFALAMAGHWGEAKTMAAIDVAPDQLNARLMQWATLARPANAYDQVAAMLGVRAVQDPGQPVALALARQPEVEVAADAPVPVPMAAMPEAAPLQAEATAADVLPAKPVFGPRREVVQPIRRAPVARPFAKAAASKPAPASRAVATKAPASGPYVVQLGAFASATVARDAWLKIAAQVPALGPLKPQGANVANGSASLYRLSVGGFARGHADALCRVVKAGGGSCFVRQTAGDAVASWYKPGSRVGVSAR